MSDHAEGHERLHAAWSRLVASVGGDDAAAASVWQELDGRYTEPFRAYHTWAHIWHVHQVMEWILTRVVAARPAIEFAVFFHDAVYDPTRQPDSAVDDETASAQFASAACGLMALDDGLTADVRALVLATRDHIARGQEQAVLCDADLAILASEPATYDVYRRAIRVEYGHIDDSMFRRGRARVLQSFLDRDRIYATSLMRDRGEAVARANVTRELAELR